MGPTRAPWSAARRAGARDEQLEKLETAGAGSASSYADSNLAPRSRAAEWRTPPSCWRGTQRATPRPPTWSSQERGRKGEGKGKERRRLGEGEGDREAIRSYVGITTREMGLFAKASCPMLTTDLTQKHNTTQQNTYLSS